MARLTTKPRPGHRQQKHPYLAGNFAPVSQTWPLTPCSYTGTIPRELVGGQYVRNGGNPVTNDDLGRDAHWFDGDGMLSGVLFRRKPEGDGVQPEFVNQFILTDLLLSTASTPGLRYPLLPSIATLVNPASTLFLLLGRILRAVLFVVLSHLPGSLHAIRRISVANTGVLYHDGRALATCESGPPIRIQLPGLETVGWFDGSRAEGEPDNTQPHDHQEVFGGKGVLAWMREWTTGHPKVDPVTGEMVLYHNCFQPPFVRYSVLPDSSRSNVGSRLVSAPVSGVSGSKMMHDFGVSLEHTVIIDLPLSLDMFNLACGKPCLLYEPSKQSRFGVFPRRQPTQVHWFETNACCIFHTANTWDTTDKTGVTTAVNLLACRLTSAALVYNAGNLMVPGLENDREVPACEQTLNYPDEKDTSSFFSELESPPQTPQPSSAADKGECNLYFYSFDLENNRIAAQHALSRVTFEFPSVRPDREMQFARYVYGCSSSEASFGTALGRVAGIDVLVKFDVHALISRGQQHPPPSVTGCVDSRSTREVLESNDRNDPIRCFRMPERWYAQEPRFVPRADSTSEDDGYLLFYVFNEGQLDPNGACCPDAVSELWVLDAKNMSDIVARVRLPQRVPYGLHGSWFPEVQIAGQRAVETIRRLPSTDEQPARTVWTRVRDGLVGAIG